MKKNLKKFATFLLIIPCILIFTACNKNDEPKFKYTSEYIEENLPDDFKITYAINNTFLNGFYGVTEIKYVYNIGFFTMGRKGDIYYLRLEVIGNHDSSDYFTNGVREIVSQKNGQEFDYYVLQNNLDYIDEPRLPHLQKSDTTAYEMLHIHMNWSLFSYITSRASYLDNIKQIGTTKYKDFRLLKPGYLNNNYIDCVIYRNDRYGWTATVDETSGLLMNIRHDNPYRIISSFSPDDYDFTLIEYFTGDDVIIPKFPAD